MLLTFVFIVSCGNVGKILRNEKIKTTDEFLVEKKKPLILPPDLDEIPKPGSTIETRSQEKDVLKNILKEKKSGKISVTTSTSVEESILKRLPK